MPGPVPADKSIQLVKKDIAIRNTYHKKIKLFRNILDAHKIQYSKNESHITPIVIGDSILCKKIADQLLFQFGIYVQPINYPTVKNGEACLRITVTPKHEEADMQYLAASLTECLHRKGLKNSTHTAINIDLVLYNA